MALDNRARSAPPGRQQGNLQRGQSGRGDIGTDSIPAQNFKSWSYKNFLKSAIRS